MKNIVFSAAYVRLSPKDHLPYTCTICLTLVERRAAELAAYRERRARACPDCGFLRPGHAPDCERPRRGHAS